MTMIDTSDSRFQKAVALADQAGQWFKSRTPDGRSASDQVAELEADHEHRRVQD